MESVVRVIPHENFTLELWFDDGSHRLFDARPYLERGILTRLKRWDEFRLAHVGLGTVCWPGGLDIAPETLYDKSVPLASGEPLNLATG